MISDILNKHENNNSNTKIGFKAKRKQKKRMESSELFYIRECFFTVIEQVNTVFNRIQRHRMYRPLHGTVPLPTPEWFHLLKLKFCPHESPPPFCLQSLSLSSLRTSEKWEHIRYAPLWHLCFTQLNTFTFYVCCLVSGFPWCVYYTFSII